MNIFHYFGYISNFLCLTFVVIVETLAKDNLFVLKTND